MPWNFWVLNSWDEFSDPVCKQKTTLLPWWAKSIVMKQRECVLVMLVETTRGCRITATRHSSARGWGGEAFATWRFVLTIVLIVLGRVPGHHFSKICREWQTRTKCCRVWYRKPCWCYEQFINSHWLIPHPFISFSAMLVSAFMPKLSVVSVQKCRTGISSSNPAGPQSCTSSFPVPPHLIQLKKLMVVSREVESGLLNERKPQQCTGLGLETPAVDQVY